MRMRDNRKQYSEIKDRPTTPQRRLLLDILRQDEGHLDARGLYRRAIEKDSSISLATVYRNLRMFKDLGLIEEVRLDEARCYYEIKRSSNHYHMVCRSCGRVTEFESTVVADLISEVQRHSGFEVTRAELYLEGRCCRCTDSEEDS